MSVVCALAHKIARTEREGQESGVRTLVYAAGERSCANSSKAEEEDVEVWPGSLR